MNADFICKKINKKHMLKLNLVIENDKGVENFDVALLLLLLLGLLSF